MKNIYLTFLVLFSLAINVQDIQATTYTFLSASASNWTDASKWNPSYPGTTISAGDVVNIIGVCRMNVDVDIEGTLTVNLSLRVNSGESLTIENDGELNINGTLTIEGTLIDDGTLTNNNQIELDSGGELRLKNNPAQWPEGDFN